MENNLQKNQNLSIINMKLLTMNGVVDIAAFDEEYILLETSLGNISIEGSNLKITSLSSDTGEIIICGEITGFYTSTKNKRSGIFKKFWS